MGVDREILTDMMDGDDGADVVHVSVVVVDGVADSPENSAYEERPEKRAPNSNWHTRQIAYKNGCL